MPLSFLAFSHTRSFEYKLGIPSAPLGDEHIAVGYQGIVNLGETILEILAHRKFHEDIQAHVKLPYKKWWLEQKDAYILAKHPEIIEEEDEADGTQG